MRITICAVGKIKETYWREALQEYQKRLGRYCRLEIREVADEKTPDLPSSGEQFSILEKEGERLLQKIPEEAYSIALAIEGTPMASAELAKKIEDLGIQGQGHIAFIIGGSLGLSQRVLTQCRMQLSFSSMTFPHQMMRVILLEQIYRSFRIIAHEPYHK